jgi:nucleolin
MAKDKKASKGAAAAAPTPKQTEKVKAGRVTKPAEKAKSVAKETAKTAAKKVEKVSKKKAKKEPTPEPSSDEEEETSESSASSDSEEEAAPAPKAKVNGTAKAPAKKDESNNEDSDDSEDDDEDSDDEEDAKAGAVKESETSEEDSDDPDDEEEEKPAAKAKTNGVAKAKVSTNDCFISRSSVTDLEQDEEDSSDEEDDDDSVDSSDDDEEEEKKPAPKAEETASKKRKADTEAATPVKRAKVMIEGTLKEPVANLFVGQLSWNVDEDWLTREFEEFGELTRVKVITDRESQRSKGYGYVEFANVESAIKAVEAKQGAEIDGRNIRIDFSEPRKDQQGNANPQQRSSDRAQKYGDKVSEPSATLFVGNISFDANEASLTEYFSEYGTIKGIRLPTDRDSGAPKGFGYVEMGSIDEAKAALEGLQGAELSGRPLRLDYSTPKPNNDGGRGGFGGGFGGRGRGGGRGGFGDRGGRGGRGGFGGRGRGAPRGGRGGTTNRGGFGDFSGKKQTFDD